VGAPDDEAVSIAPAGVHEAQLIAERRENLSRLRDEGVEPFPPAFPGRTPVADVHAAHVGLDVGDHPELRYRVAGRLVARRDHGKAQFLDLEDRSGRMQLYARRDHLGDGVYERLSRLDVGDIVGADGHVYVTKRQELSLKVEGFAPLAKALRPPPEMHHGLEDPETRYRHRELDLMSSPESRELFVTRARVIRTLRDWMAEHDFIEVESPNLQPLYGGAFAAPFTTHHNALERELYLRISTELYLKRCVVGGMENVYELGKCFRNEGLSSRHNPEFTMLEWFQAYADYHDVLAFIERMVAETARRVNGTTKIHRAGREIDLAPPWRRLTVADGIREVTGVDVFETPRIDLEGALEGVTPGTTWGRLVDALFCKYVEPTLIEPTFVIDPPAELNLVAKRHREDDRLVESFEAFVGGLEVSSGCTDIHDPDEQRERFESHAERRAVADDLEAQPYDEDYVRALEHGMIPASGAGIGVDRLVMLLTGRESLREVVLFPVMRDRA
jgi:lysyl-tRNA synthetase class 2